MVEIDSGALDATARNSLTTVHAKTAAPAHPAKQLLGVELFDNANLLFEKPLRNPRISLRAHMLAQIVQNSRQAAFLP
jgi:hypothetical protein